MDVAPLLEQVGRRLRRAAWLRSGAAGLVAAAASVAAVGLVGRAPAAGLVVGAALGTALMLVGQRRAGVWTASAAAQYVERRAGGLDNLLVSAADLQSGTLVATDRMRGEVLSHARQRVATLDPAALAPIGRAAAQAMLAALGLGAVLVALFGTRQAGEVSTGANGGAASVIGAIRVTVEPPAYLAEPPRTLDDPEDVTLPAGSRVNLDVRSTAGAAWIELPGVPAHALRAEGDGAFRGEWTPDVSQTLVVAAGDDVGRAAASRLVRLHVVPDEPPRVVIAQPGRDLAFASAATEVSLVVEAEDVQGLQDLQIRYIKSSGSGEAFAFAEGEVPIVVERRGDRQWRGRATLSLAALGLGEGDTLVYRARVRDTNPAGEWVASDAFTIDVGARLEFAGAGFAVPDEDRRYAISQQMVILKTERLQADRARLEADAVLEQSRGLAVEQRMVRAEVVFLSGGEVQDEVEEAAHAHELQEGRLESTGRAEMLRALNEMSRAEARLNAGDLPGALVFERAALAALQRAFDRRRYFLRTLSERARIDTTRRLSGDRKGARSATRASAADDDPLAEARQLARDLAQVAVTGQAAAPDLLARVASTDGGSAEWRDLAASLLAAAGPESRRDAAERAMVRLAAQARQALGDAGPVVVLDELRGRWRDEWHGGPPR